MNGISKLLDYVLSFFSRVPFDTLLLSDVCAFGGIFALTVILCALSRKIRYADKRAFLHLLNAFSAVTLALLCTHYSAAQSIAFAAIFWCVGYLLYGLLCVLSRPRAEREESAAKPVPALAPARAFAGSPAHAVPPTSVPAVHSAVRLDHALSVADKLLLKALGRGDRQELEKIKTTLTVLKVKGELTVHDGEILNDTFNALLKLMAKYNV